MLIALLLLADVNVRAADDPPQPNPYLSELIQKARGKKLGESRFWLLLLHYRRSWSEADGKRFFFAEKGKTDPEAELEATLAHFFDPPVEETETLQHPQCMFPARYRWLKEQLEIDPARLPDQPCAGFDHFREQLDPGSVTFIFAAAYMNNPASMFGHSFLRIDRKGNKAANDLLSYIVNFAANDKGSDGIMWAVNGIFGGFPGFFSTTPYYLMVQTYSDMESRDLWEYRLSLTDGQIDWMVRHMWELGNTWFDYWFFTENCSYHLLSLIEVARPDLHLREQFDGTVIPINTLKLVASVPGLVTETRYRPSVVNRMQAKRRLLNTGEAGTAAGIGGSRRPERFSGLDKLDSERQVRVLDAASLYFQTHSVKGETPDQRDAAEREILLKRGRLGPPLPEAPVEEPPAPHQGHDSARIGLGGGADRHQSFEEIRLRPAIHDLLSNDTGYPANSELEMLSFRGRYENRARKFILDEAELLRITSIYPFDPWSFKLSWKAHTGAVLPREKRCDRWRCLTYYGNAGAGLAARTSLWRREIFYVFAEAEGAGGGVFDRQFRLGPGVSGGLLFDVASRSRIHAEGRYLVPLLGDPHRVWESSVYGTVYLSRNWELRAGAKTGTAPDELSGGLYWYF